MGRLRTLGPGTIGGGHEASVIPELPEGLPKSKAASEDAAHFMIRMVHQYPHEVTIYEGGPMTDLALALTIDPEFSQLAEELVFMGGSLSPVSDDPEFENTPRHEFNFWFDPEAARTVLREFWKKIVCTPTDISVRTRLTPAMIKEIDAGGTALARYVAKYYSPGRDRTSCGTNSRRPPGSIPASLRGMSRAT